MRAVYLASEEVRGSFCRDDSCVITDQLATGPGALERELLGIVPNVLADHIPVSALQSAMIIVSAIEAHVDTVIHVKPGRSGTGRARQSLRRTGEMSGNAGAFARPTYCVSRSWKTWIQSP